MFTIAQTELVSDALKVGGAGLAVLVGATACGVIMYRQIVAPMLTQARGSSQDSVAMSQNYREAAADHKEAAAANREAANTNLRAARMSREACRFLIDYIQRNQIPGFMPNTEDEPE